MPDAPDPDLATVLARLDTTEAATFLNTDAGPIDWSAATGRVVLRDGARLYFEPTRRSVRIERVDGGLLVLDLGRRDRMRSVEAILSPDLVRHDGPVLEVGGRPVWNGEKGEIAVRDPLDRAGKRAADIVVAGPYATSRFVDGHGRAQVIAAGEVEALWGFGAFSMDGGAKYACLRTSSGLGCFYDASRVAFMKAVTDEVVEQARAEGFALVVTKAGPIGVVFDCGAPGDYLALSAYHRDTHAGVGVVVDLRRPPVMDGAIVDPTP